MLAAKEIPRARFAKAYFTGLLLASLTASGQGEFIYDQQSSTNEAYPPGQTQEIQPYQPFGQSFIPNLSAVGFVRLFVADSVFSNGSDATISVNLMANSITGSILAATSPMHLSGNSFGYITFYFANPVAVTPGVTYYFQPIVASPDNWRTALLPGFTYVNGTAFVNGLASSSVDLWFREGIVVPEPSAAFLILFGVGLAGCWHRWVNFMQNR